MIDMIIRIFAFIGIFITIVIPWFLGVAAIFVMIGHKLDDKGESNVDELSKTHI